MFDGCNSLISLPNVSKWNISNVSTIRGMLYECNSLISLPDISKMNSSNITNKENKDNILDKFENYGNIKSVDKMKFGLLEFD